MRKKNGELDLERISGVKQTIKMTPEQRLKTGRAVYTNKSVSVKQLEVLRIILRGNPDGSHVDKKQIVERVTYTDKKESVLFLIRYLTAQGRVEKCEPVKRYEGKRKVVVYRLTDAGRRLVTNIG